MAITLLLLNRLRSQYQKQLFLAKLIITLLPHKWIRNKEKEK